MLPLNPARLPEMFREARRLHAAGQLTRARQAYETMLKIKPDMAEVHFKLGELHLQAGDTEDSIRHLDRAATLAPGQKAIWQLCATALVRIADPERSTAFLARAKKARLDREVLMSLQQTLFPKQEKSKTSIGSAPPEDIQRAIRLLQGGKPQDAAALALRLHNAHPKVAIIADILALAEAALGKIDAAESHFRLAVKLDPDYAEAHANYGHFLAGRRRHDAAITEFRAALDRRKDLPSALVGLGTALVRTGRYAAAVPALRRALQLDPNSVPARLELGEAFLMENNPLEAIAVVTPLAGQRFPNAIDRVLVARAYAAMMQNEKAEHAYDDAIEAASDKAVAISAKANFLQLLGRFKESEALFRRALELNPLNGPDYSSFLLAHKTQPGDPLIGQMEEIYKSPDIPDQDRMHIGFALAKALEDTKTYDRVFTYLRPANDYVHRNSPFDVAKRDRSVNALIKTFEGVDFAARSAEATTDFAPVFVTGLPRSGTTLVEQIIASHSRVTGGGELGYASDEINRAIGGGGDGDLAAFDLSTQDLKDLGDVIERRMRNTVPDADVITDKGMQSYMFIGAIKLILPKAKIIVVRRDPRDNLLSMYKNLFLPGRHLYSYNLRTLGHYFHGFQKIIGFWRRKTPDWFVDIQYEDLIANPETEARKLIAACGLDWEDQCLAFHENKRRIDTLSVHQVRQPLYSTSLKAWQRYESDLGELFDALGPEYDPRRPTVEKG